MELLSLLQKQDANLIHSLYLSTANTSLSSVPLQKFFSTFKMWMVSFSLREEYASLGISEEQRKKPGILEKKDTICQHKKNLYRLFQMIEIQPLNTILMPQFHISVIILTSQG